jgi:hypothetical protein
MAYNYSAILHVGEAGLEYVDEYGDTRFVDFEVCNQNAARHLLYNPSIGCVARRNTMRGWPDEVVDYVEFFTEPVTKFVFDSDEDFSRLRWRIEQVGWKVFAS